MWRAQPGIADAIRALRARVRGRRGRRGRVRRRRPRCAVPGGWRRRCCWRRSRSGRSGPCASPSGATAAAPNRRATARSHVRVRCGRPLDPVVLRSYCIGAAHMALGWVRSEGLAVDDHGVPVDLTIRSFGILRAVDTPPIEIEIERRRRRPRQRQRRRVRRVATRLGAVGWHEHGRGATRACARLGSTPVSAPVDRTGDYRRTA